MNKKILVILSCCGILAIATILLLVFFVPENKKEGNQLYCSASNIDINVGNVVYDYYSLSHENASISIVVSKTTVIDIDKDMIYGKAAGEVQVTLTATLDKQKSSTTFIVKVYEQDYRIEFTAVENCQIEGNTIKAQSKLCSFKVQVFDMLGKLLESVKYQIAMEGDGEYVENFSIIMLNLDGDCVMNFNFIELDFSVKFYVFLQEG